MAQTHTQPAAHTAVKAQLKIMSPRCYRLRSTSGQTYAVIRGHCCGSKTHRPSDTCKHVRFVKVAETATVRPQTAIEPRGESFYAHTQWCEGCIGCWGGGNV